MRVKDRFYYYKELEIFFNVDGKGMGDVYNELILRERGINIFIV